MRISIISDVHLGFGSGTEREEDAFAAFSEAVEKSLGSDIILMGGDIFDCKIPSSEVFSRALEIFSRPVIRGKKTVEISGGVGKDVSSISQLAKLGVPVIAIHGTHERRAKGLVNPLEALEKAGFLIHLHHNAVIFQKGGEKVAVFGLSGVPDQYAWDVLKEWDPKPVPGCFNIMMVHQSFSEFIYAPGALPLKALPAGFDLYVCGHIHERQQTTLHGKPLVVTGSLVSTQLRPAGKGEWIKEEPKGMWVIEAGPRPAINWELLDRQREIYYGAFATVEEAETKVKELVSSEKRAVAPVVRVSLPAGQESRALEKRFEGAAIISIKKAAKDEKPAAVSMEQQHLSVQEMGRKLLAESLRKAGLDPVVFEQFFELLAEGKSSEASAIIEKVH